MVKGAMPIISERDAILGEIKDYICNTIIPGTDYVYYSLKVDPIEKTNGSSDTVDVYGVHIKPVRDILSIYDVGDIISKSVEFENGLKIRFISHDVKAELKAILTGDYTAYERLHSEPFMVTERYQKMREISHIAVSKEVAMSYYNIASMRYDKYLKTGKDKAFQSAPAQKYLFMIAPLLAGIFLLETGVFEANIAQLNKKYNYKPVNEILESSQIDDAIANAFIKDLFVTFNSVKDKSKLHDKSTERAEKEANDFLISCRSISNECSMIIYGTVKEYTHHDKMDLSSIVIATHNGIHQVVGDHNFIKKEIETRYHVGDSISIRANTRFDWEVLHNNMTIRPTSEPINLDNMVQAARRIREELQNIYTREEKQEWGIEDIDILEHDGKLSQGQGKGMAMPKGS